MQAHNLQAYADDYFSNLFTLIEKEFSGLKSAGEIATIKRDILHVHPSLAYAFSQDAVGLFLEIAKLFYPYCSPSVLDGVVTRAKAVENSTLSESDEDLGAGRASFYKILYAFLNGKLERMPSFPLMLHMQFNSKYIGHIRKKGRLDQNSRIYGLHMIINVNFSSEEQKEFYDVLKISEDFFINPSSCSAPQLKVVGEKKKKRKKKNNSGLNIPIEGEKQVELALAESEKDDLSSLHDEKQEEKVIEDERDSYDFDGDASCAASRDQHDKATAEELEKIAHIQETCVQKSRQKKQSLKGRYREENVPELDQSMSLIRPILKNGAREAWKTMWRIDYKKGDAIKVKWKSFIQLATQLGFSVTPGSGSVRRFTHPSGCSFFTHEPHESYQDGSIGKYMLDNLREVLETNLGMTVDSYTI